MLSFFIIILLNLLTDSQNSAVGSGSPRQSLVQIRKVQLCDIHPPLNGLSSKPHALLLPDLWLLVGVFFFKASSILTSLSHNLNGSAFQINLMLYLWTWFCRRHLVQYEKRSKVVEIFGTLPESSRKRAVYWAHCTTSVITAMCRLTAPQRAGRIEYKASRESNV